MAELKLRMYSSNDRYLPYIVVITLLNALPFSVVPEPTISDTSDTAGLLCPYSFLRHYTTIASHVKAAHTLRRLTRPQLDI